MLIRNTFIIIISFLFIASLLPYQTVIAHEHKKSSHLKKKAKKLRTHTASTAKNIRLVAANKILSGFYVDIKIKNNKRHIMANGIPNHKVGRFPNRGNPHDITAQKYNFKVSVNPIIADEITSARGYHFGIAVNGVPLDPYTAEFWQGRKDLDWNYDALGGAVGLGLDANHGHVQPNGSYHYHGVPTGLIALLSQQQDDYLPIIGWAADGFPIFSVVQHHKKENKMTTSYRLKKGQRRDDDNQQSPSGRYDGAFTKDYKYIAGLGNLDECNGIFIDKHPDYPNGTYAYFITQAYPFISRCFRGIPDRTFQKKKKR